MRRILSKFFLSIFILSFTVDLSIYAGNLVREINKFKISVPKSYYKVPSPNELEALRMGIWHMSQKEFSGAEIQAGKIGYRVYSITHLLSDGTRREYKIFGPKDPVYSPWGIYVFYLEDDANNLVIEVPFPKDEYKTAKLGTEVFIETKAKALVIGGCSKSRCDVSAVSDNPFHIAQKELVGPQTAVIQFQTFSNSRYPDIVLSSGYPSGNLAMDQIFDSISEDFDVGVYNGIDYVSLSLKNNLQARYANRIGADFVGILLNKGVYNSKRRAEKLVKGIKDVYVQEEVTESSSSDTGTGS